jgi:3-oxoacyl-[acyl-carrier-protein] synthase-1
MRNAVHLNALGLVCALGQGKEQISSRLFEEHTGVVTLENAAGNGVSLPFAPVSVSLSDIPVSLRRYASRNLALVLTALAEIESELSEAIARYGEHRVAVVMGTSTSGISVGEELLKDAQFRESNEFPTEFDFLRQEIGSTAESIALLLNLAGPATTISTACSSSAKAFAMARRFIDMNLADAVVVGGCDSRCALTLGGFHSLSALSRTGCKPFSANRDGTVIGEGAAIFLMSREPVGPVLAGVGESSDAYNMTAPDPVGGGAIAAMTRALGEAGIEGRDLGYVNLHGTGTTLNDAMESRAVADVLGDDVPCSSSKGQIGHTLGAAGAVETALCWLTMECNPDNKLPPHLWDGEPAEDAPLPGMVKNENRISEEKNLYVMSNSYAFGGSNVSVVLGSNDGP